MNPAQRLLKRKTQERAMALMMERQRLKRKTRPQANDPGPVAPGTVVLDSMGPPVLRMPDESRLAFQVRLQESPVTETRIGVWDGYCNRRSACRQPHARWWNRGSYAHYCFDCAYLLNTDRFNAREAQEMFGGPLCVEMDSAQHWPHGEPRYHHEDDVLPEHVRRY